MGIFYEPTRVFRNLRPHPRWLAAFLVITVVTVVYAVAFARRLTPERIVNYTMEKLEQSPIKPPPDQMEKTKEDGECQHPFATANGSVIEWQRYFHLHSYIRPTRLIFLRGSAALVGPS